MIIEARMKCEAVRHYESCREVTLQAVTAHSAENATWAKFTPSGSITLVVTNPDVYDAFVPGGVYKILFQRLEKQHAHSE